MIAGKYLRRTNISSVLLRSHFMKKGRLGKQHGCFIIKFPPSCLLFSERATHTTHCTRIDDTRTRACWIKSIRFCSLTHSSLRNRFRITYSAEYESHENLERCISSGPKLCAVQRRGTNRRGNHAAERDRRYREMHAALIEMRKLSQRQDGREYTRNGR